MIAHHPCARTQGPEEHKAEQESVSSAALLCLSTMSRLLGLIFVALMALGVPVQATSLTAKTRHLNLLPSLSYLEDPSGSLTLAEVIARDAQFQAWMGGGSKLNAGFTPSAYRVKLTLHREAGAPTDNLGHKSDYYDVRRMEIMARRLRKKIETQGGEPLPLETIYGRGYAFTGSGAVERQPA